MRTIQKTILIFLGVVMGLGMSAYAAEDQFQINLTVTTPDAITPSIPQNLSATPVSSSQIDLSWDASTDNIGVTGYRIYRDNLFIDTSAITTYSDTGLTQETQYSYTVSAVDAASNESAQSATATAITLAEEVVSGGGSSGGGYLPLRIENVNVFPAYTNAIITWNTRPNTVYTVLWGKSASYDEGAVTGNTFAQAHQSVLDNLLPNTQYYFRIISKDFIGREIVREGTFFTFPLSQEGVPNATLFKAASRERDIQLSWNNPEFAEFDGVRLVKSPFFYPGDPNDGEVVFEGSGEGYVDAEVEVGKTYYYTLFVKSENGEYSSGSVAQTTITLPGEPEPLPPEEEPELPSGPFVHPDIASLSFLDFEFIQEGILLTSFSGNVIAIDGRENLTVSLDYDKVPEVLKTIVITLVSPDDETQVFSFLLRVNEDRSAYSATIGPLGRSGIYEARIAVLDYKNKGLKRITGTLTASVAETYDPDSKLASFIEFILRNKLIALLLILLVALTIYYVVRSRKSLRSKFAPARS